MTRLVQHVGRGTRLCFRWMGPGDLHEVMEIERASFATPWTAQDLKDVRERRDVSGYVATDGRKIVGFSLLELGRTAVVLISLAVAPESRRLGVGTALVEQARRRLGGARRVLRADVHDADLPMHLFLRSCGLRAVAVLPGHFPDGDAYRFEWPMDLIRTGDSPL